MHESRFYHCLNITIFFCTSVDLLSPVEVLQHHGTHVVVSNITELGG